MMECLQGGAELYCDGLNAILKVSVAATGGLSFSWQMVLEYTVLCNKSANFCPINSKSLLCTVRIILDLLVISDFICDF